MRTVWKYELSLVDGPQCRPMPRGATVLHARDQYGDPCLWAEVDPSRTLVDRWFVVEGTGHPIEHDGVYVGTAMSHGGALVWHIFETTGGAS